MSGDWIDVKNDLPDDGTTVLIHHRQTTGIGDFEDVWLGYYEGGQWFTVDGDPIEVPHWMNLPEPPQ